MDSFFQDIQKSDEKKTQRDWEDLVFVLVNEFHWTQEDIWNTDIPFIFNMIEARTRVLKEQDRQLRKKK